MKLQWIRSLLPLLALTNHNTILVSAITVHVLFLLTGAATVYFRLLLLNFFSLLFGYRFPIPDFSAARVSFALWQVTSAQF